MRKTILLLIWILFIFKSVAIADVTVTANRTNIPRGQAQTINLQYRFISSSPAPETCILVSTSGQFIAGNSIIDTNSRSLGVNIVNNFGTATETLNIPIKIVERAIKRGFNTFQYVRNFYSNPVANCSGFNSPIKTLVTFYITTEAGADFDIKRIELYFENRRAEITVPKNYKGLKAFADIKFTGSGLLKGYWEVDGRILSHVNQHITYGRTVTLQTPEIPPLPTFETGTHILRFVITTPSVEIPFPSAIYFVTTQELREFIKIKILSPEDNAKLDYIPQKFTWESLDGTMLYLIQFFETKDSNPIFSAYTREAFYSIPELILEKIFQPGKTYYWKVIGFDESNNKVGESNLWDFSFVNTGFVPGQIIIALSKKDFSENFIEELKRKYELEVIDFFSLETISSVLILLKTDRNIFDKIEQIKSETKISFAQPNYIFQTFTEPMRKLQYAFDLMKTEKIHNFFKGKGVKVAVIDTGIDYEHKDLIDRVSIKKNFIKGEEYRREIHGTAVAGVIGASINDFGIKGVVPEVSIYAFRACRQVNDSGAGKCKSSDVAKALEEAILSGVKVVNMSFGTFFYDELIASIIDKATSSGIFIVTPFTKINDKVVFPASYPKVISVGGLDEKGKPYPDENKITEAKVLAPAINIFTTIPNNKHNFLSCTSLSSAHVSGLLAL